MKIVITGSRNWKDYAAMEAYFQESGHNPKQTTIIHGDCQGADRMAGQIALKLGYAVYKIPAPWALLPKTAGIVRNSWLLDTEPDLVWGFLIRGVECNGTRDCLAKARSRRIETVEFWE